MKMSQATHEHAWFGTTVIRQLQEDRLLQLMAPRPQPLRGGTGAAFFTLDLRCRDSK